MVSPLAKLFCVQQKKRFALRQIRLLTLLKIILGSNELVFNIIMPTRRQEKVARLVKEVVSEAIAQHLNDPRITGFVSVTRVEMAPNLRDAEVYLSVFGKNESDQKKTFIAIEHSRTRIQSFLAGAIKSRFCPILHFHQDVKFKKTLEMFNLIDEAVGGLEDTDISDDEEFSDKEEL